MKCIVRLTIIFYITFMCKAGDTSCSVRFRKPSPCTNDHRLNENNDYEGFCAINARLHLMYTGLQSIGKLDDFLNAFKGNKKTRESFYAELIALYKSHNQHHKPDVPFDIVGHIDAMQKRDSWNYKSLFQETAFFPEYRNIMTLFAPYLFSEARPEQCETELLIVKHTSIGRVMPPVSYVLRGGRYNLIGILFEHDYDMPCSELTGRSIAVDIKVIREMIHRLFRGKVPLKYKLPSATIMKYVNFPWNQHYDCALRCGEEWFVMDDTTRWRVRVKKDSCPDKIFSDPQSCARGIVAYYPGHPVQSLYVRKKGSERSEGYGSSFDSDSSLRALVIERDTPRPLGKLIGLTVFAGIADGLTIAAPLNIFRYYNTTIGDMGIACGFFVACASIISHAQHLWPLLKKRITYTVSGSLPQIKGPRHPNFAFCF